MAFSRRRHFKKRRPERFNPHHGTQDLVHPEQTGSESAFLKSLVDSHATVTVVLKNGEKFRVMTFNLAHAVKNHASVAHLFCGLA